MTTTVCPTCGKAFRSQKQLNCHHPAAHGEKTEHEQNTRIPTSAETREELEALKFSWENWDEFLRRMYEYNLYVNGELDRPWRNQHVLDTLYWGHEHSLSEMADILDVGEATIRSQMEKFNIPRRSRGGCPSTDPGVDVLRELRVEQGLTLRELGDELGVSHMTAKKRLKEAGIE